jgi:hypothetical protein
MAFMLLASPVLGDDVPKLPGSLLGNWVGANCVLGPYSESL